ncbi:HugZ family protein [Zoogloea sp.]|uniref:HugZ family pyridoxamine 5'-phosphate oxidase n=1 Tax=Zoogloea sp. TaxID=49181 RepID=UPI0035AD7A36
MKIDYAEVRALLRRSRSGALGTQSLGVPGYPFVSALPYVPDEAGCPVFLLSELAEHTRNLRADSRASLLVTEGPDGDLAQSRLTLVGDVTPVSLDAGRQARYLRYRPDAAEYLALGDFRFFRLMPFKARFIGGFGRMGWIDAETLPAMLAPEIEMRLVERLARLAPVGVGVLGIDCEGVDLRIGGIFRRLALPPTDGSVAALEAAAGGVLLQAEPTPPAAAGSDYA